MSEDRILELPPSLLVSYSVSVPGDVRYETIEEDIKQDGEDVETTKTTIKRVRGAEERERAQLLAGRLRKELKRFGRPLHSGVLIVPKSVESDLDGWLSDARARAREHNFEARHHQVRLSVIRAVMLADTEETARDLAGRIQLAVSQLESAIADCDVERIRAIATETGRWADSGLLPETDSETLREATKSARRAARKIAAVARETGGVIDSVRDEIQTEEISRARFAFGSYAGPEELSGLPDEEDSGSRYETREGPESPEPEIVTSPPDLDDEFVERFQRI